MSDLSAAEKRMTALEEKLLSLETAAISVSSDASVEDALKKYQITMLTRLKALRELPSHSGKRSVICREHAIEKKQCKIAV